jgi:hypothetical protein
MNRPEKKNAISAAMYQALDDALREADPAVRAVVIHGVRGAFTAGNDLEDFLARRPGGSSPALQETGLVWDLRTNTSPPRSWSAAMEHCNRRLLGQRAGWRLPTLQELASLLDPTQDLALPSGHPFLGVGAVPPVFWSASTKAETPTPGTDAWLVTFTNHGGIGIADKGDTNQPWCVRSGQGVDPQ